MDQWGPQDFKKISGGGGLWSREENRVAGASDPKPKNTVLRAHRHVHTNEHIHTSPAVGAGPALFHVSYV